MGEHIDRLLNFFKGLRNARRRRSYNEDPAKGIEYNEINANHRVSKKIFNADIARHPNVVKDIGEWVNVQKSAHKANRERTLVDYKRGRIRGRER